MYSYTRLQCVFVYAYAYVYTCMQYAFAFACVCACVCARMHKQRDGQVDDVTFRFERRKKRGEWQGRSPKPLSTAQIVNAQPKF